MASREPYTQAHDEDMLEFWETKMKEGNEIARDPCGFRLWEEYIRQGHSQRTRDSLTSHFRKQVLPKLTTWSWTATRKLELVKKWGVSIDKNMQTSLERNCKAVLKLGNAGNLKSWTFMAPKQRRSGESSTAPPKRPSPPQRRIRPVIVEDEDVIITEDEEDEVVQTKRIKNEPVAIEDPTMNELDWTREIRVLKEHRRVRHSTREALGLPPITTPPHLREQQPDQSMEPALSDDSFVREEDNKANEGFVERQTEQQVLPDGQGNDIDTITDLTEISSHPASTSTSQISQQFRSKACNAAFKRLKEVQKCIKDDLLPVFRKIERQIEIGSLSQLEYLDKLAEAAEDFMLTVQAATRPLPNSLESPSKIRLIRLPHDNISPAHRAEKASSLWKSFASTTPKGLFDRVREVIEEREPLILRTSDSMEQYDQKILKLEQDLKTEVAKNLA